MSMETSSTPEYSGLGTASIAPQLLQQFAPKPLPPELSRQIERMLDVRSPGLGFILNSGKTLYFSWDVTGRPQVWKIDGASSLPTQLTGGEERSYLVGMTPNEKLLVIARDRDGQENPGLYIQKTTGGPLVKIFQKSGVRASFQGASDDSRYLYYSANDKKPSSATLYRFELASGVSEPLLDEEGTWFVADRWKDQKLLLGKALGNMQIEFYDLDLSSRKLSPVFGQGKSEEIWMNYGQSDNEYLVQTNMFGNFRRLYVMKDGAFNPITPDVKYDVEQFKVDFNRSMIAVVTDEDGFRKTQILDAKTYTPVEWPKIEADHVIAGNFSYNSKFLTLGIERGNEPRATYVYDFETKELKKWLAASAPEVDVDSFATATAETYPARDGTMIPMLVRRPLACQEPCPVIVHFHGGPEGQASPGFSTFAQNFVDAGFIYAEPNVRGSDGFGKEWVNADNGAKRLSVITDIEDAALYFREKAKKIGKPVKIGVMGYSYGGYSTLMAMTRFAGSFDAGVALVGISNLLTFLKNTAPYRRHLRISEYGDPEKDADVLTKLSPITYIDQVKGPLMIIQGATDPRVPAGEAIQMYEALKKKGLDAELILFANEGHGSIDRANQVLEIGHTLQFFKKHLQGR